MKRSEWYKILKERVNTSPLSQYVGQKLTKVWRGRAEITLEIKKHHLQGRGQLHGGWYGFISDTAGFFSVMSLCEPEDGATTLEYKVNLISPATPLVSPVKALAKVIKRTGQIAVAYVEVVDKKGDICSTFLGTYRIFPGKAQEFQEKLKKKGVVPPSVKPK
jgi:uncharacterized protein (TIGR00369 family)